MPTLSEPPDPEAWEQVIPPDVVTTGDQANQYLHHVRRALPEFAGQAGHHVGPNISTFWSRAPKLTARLWIRVGSESSTAVTFALTGPRGVVREEKPRWRAILEEALRSLIADTPPERPWAAILVPKAAQNARWEAPFRVWPDRLAEPVQVGPMLLTSAPTWVTQPYPHPDDISMPLGVGYWPLLVTGTTSAYLRAGALQAAAQDLLRLQQLLALVTARSWERGRQPELMEREGMVENLLAAWLARMEFWSLGEGLPRPDSTVLNLPEWLPNAWAETSRKRRLTHALSAYGRAFEHFTGESTSDAGARFAAVAETLAGTRNSADAKREVSDYLVTATEGRLTPENAKKAAESILMYELRSKTVHNGRLHGPDAFGGLPLGMVSANGDPSSVHHQMTGNLQHLCRNLLIHTLGGPLHDPAPILKRLAEIQEGVITLGPPAPK